MGKPNIGVQLKVVGNSLPPRPLISDKDVMDFLRLMKRSEYKVIEQLDNASTQIFLLNLLLTSELHRKALLKVLNEAQIPKNIPVDKLSDILGNVLASNHVSYSNDDLTYEGIGHNKALYI